LVDPEDLITRWYRVHGNPNSCTVEEVLQNHVGMVEALAVSMILMPRTRIVEDYVILDMPGRNRGSEDEVSLRDTLAGRRKIKMDLQDFVDSFNWIESPYLFASGPLTEDEKRDDKYDALCADIEKAICEQMKDSWAAWLNWTYKDRAFQVFILSPEETGSTYGVGFRETR